MHLRGEEVAALLTCVSVTRVTLEGRVLPALVPGPWLLSLPVSELVSPSAPPSPLLSSQKCKTVRGGVVAPPVLTSHLIAVTWTTNGGVDW